MAFRSGDGRDPIGGREELTAENAETKALYLAFGPWTATCFGRELARISIWAEAGWAAIDSDASFG
jgi:hypothetical protein